MGEADGLLGKGTGEPREGDSGCLGTGRVSECQGGDQPVMETSNGHDFHICKTWKKPISCKTEIVVWIAGKDPLILVTVGQAQPYAF